MTDLSQRMVSAGMKMTMQRKAIIQVLEESEDHPTVELVYERARKIDSSLSLATVYRTLSMLDELNLVQRHEFYGHQSNKQSRFETKLEDHHHLIDVKSGAVIEFVSKDFEVLVKRIAASLGYELIDVHLELYGKQSHDRD